MTLEKNKKHAREFLEKLSRAQVGPADLTEDFRAWSLFSGELTREVWLASLHGKHKVQVGPSGFTIIAMTAEGDRVAVEYVSNTALVNGKRYCNNYHTLLIFRDGKVARIKEFLDTRYLVEVLGPLIPRIENRAQELKKLEVSPRADD